MNSKTLFVSNYISYRSFLYSGHVFTVQEGIYRKIEIFQKIYFAFHFIDNVSHLYM